MSESPPDEVAGGQPAEARAEEARADEAMAVETAAEDEALAAARAEIEEFRDQHLRAVAELENQRKRAAREIANARQFAVERFAGELLAVVDSLEMGIDAGAQASAEALLEGSRATLRLLQNTFEKFGIAVVDPEGEPFDPQVHEAMTTQPSETAEPGSVLTVIQKGYTLNGRLLRPARVVVAAETGENAPEEA